MPEKMLLKCRNGYTLCGSKAHVLLEKTESVCECLGRVLLESNGTGTTDPQTPRKEACRFQTPNAITGAAGVSARGTVQHGGCAWASMCSLPLVLWQRLLDCEWVAMELHNQGVP